jgi:hypothetical protein
MEGREPHAGEGEGCWGWVEVLHDKIEADGLQYYVGPALQTANNKPSLQP